MTPSRCQGVPEHVQADGACVGQVLMTGVSGGEGKDEQLGRRL